MFDHPLTFRPLFMERIWGGRKLEEKLGKPLPPALPIGESWELVDRPDAQSVVDDGKFAGRTLHDLWMHHRKEIFGAVPDAHRFPLLAKILDARETLSVQVHPPAAVAEELRGEPKTEMWYLLDAEVGAELFAGFRRGVDRASFETALARGTAAELLHRLPVQTGDSIFIPSGRCHAIGAGCLIVELQQNSDTTYRVFDWNRLGPDGKSRALHIDESLRSIDFADSEPALSRPQGETLAACEHFQVDRWDLASARADTASGAAIFTVLSGGLTCGGRTFGVGEFFLLPAAARDRTLHPDRPGTTVLRTVIPAGAT